MNLQIKEITLHECPKLLVDRVLEIEDRKRALALKNVTANEKLFNGHFPDFPVMPGVFMVESLAQLVNLTLSQNKKDIEKKIYLKGIDKCRIRKQVHIGDQLRLQIEIVSIQDSTAIARGIIKVENEIACEGQLTFSL